MDWWLLTFFLGAVLSLFLPIVPTLFYLFFFIFLSITFYYYKPLRSASGLMFGCAWMIFNGVQYFSVWQNNDLENTLLTKQTHHIEGKVISLQSKGSIKHFKNKQADKLSKIASQRFNFLVEKLANKTLKQTFVVRLNWKNTSFFLKQGQKLNLNVRFKPAHGLANLGGFSYQTWLKGKEIVATGYVVNKGKKVNDLRASAQVINKIVKSDISIRQLLFDQFENLLNHYELEKHPLSSILFALGFGDKGKLSPELWQVLQTTGTGHLIAISGLHIGLVASGSFYLFMLFIKVLPLSLLSKISSYLSYKKACYKKLRYKKYPNQLLDKTMQINSRYWAIFFSLVVTFFYGYLAGFSLPTLRAFIMLLIYWLVRLTKIKLSLKRWLFLSLFVITLVSPFSLFSLSFWLSFYAVIIIFLTLWRFRSLLQAGNVKVKFIKGLLLIQLSLTVFLLPINALFFQQISLVALVANLLAVPWMSFITIPLCLLAMVFMPINDDISSWFVQLSLFSLDVIWQWLTFLAQQSWALLPLSAFQIFIIVCMGIFSILVIFISPFMISLSYVMGIYRLVLKKKNIVFILLIITAVWISFLTLLKPPENLALQKNKLDWTVTVLDVGQGLSVMIEQNNHAILYDTGASYPSGFNMSEAVILPYLQYRGIAQFDHVILSHSDNDHAGGLPQLLNANVVKNIKANFLFQKFNRDFPSSVIKSSLAKSSVVKSSVVKISVAKNSIVENSAVKSLAMENAILKNATVKNIPLTPCLQGQSFQWQQLSFEVLWPDSIRGEENDDSCVLKVSDGYHSILLTGDISKKIENKILQVTPLLSVDVLVVPHHGSNTSSSRHFLSLLSPKLAIVSAGYLNRWSMPTVKVSKRYQDKNIKLLNTASSGMVSVSFAEKKMVIHTQRADFWPFWFAN